VQTGFIRIISSTSDVMRNVPRILRGLKWDKEEILVVYDQCMQLLLSRSIRSLRIEIAADMAF
jgi:hypothetical protein